MNWDMVGAVGEVAGALAVVVTLIYLARQLREGARQTKINTSITLAAIGQDGFAPIYNHPEYIDIWGRGMGDVSGLTDAERGIFSMFFDRQMFNFETVIVAYEEGAYDPKLFASFQALFTDMVSSPGGQYWLTHGAVPITDRARRYLGLPSEKDSPGRVSS